MGPSMDRPAAYLQALCRDGRSAFAEMLAWLHRRVLELDSRHERSRRGHLQILRSRCVVIRGSRRPAAFTTSFVHAARLSARRAEGAGRPNCWKEIGVG